MKTLTSLIVVASAHQVEIFERVGTADKFNLNLVSKFDAELDSNHEKPDRTFNSVGVLRHGVEPHTDRRDVEIHKFVEKIAINLLELDKTKKYDDLILIASHQIISELEKNLHHHLKEKISHKLAKDLVKFDASELKKYLVDHKI